MRINRLLPAVLAGCLFLVALIVEVALSAAPGGSRARIEGAGLWLAPEAVAEASETGAPDGAVAGPDDLILYEIDNPTGSSNYWVHWSAYTDTITYTLQEGEGPEFVDPMVRYSGELTETMVTGQTGGTWYYRVKATTSEAETPWSNVVSTTVAPAAPVLNPISNPDHNGAYVVDWEPVTGIITYTLEEASSAEFLSPIVRFKGVLTSFQVVDQDSGTWFYRVKAGNDAGDSPWSNIEATDVRELAHLPLVVKHWPPLPYAPVLDPLSDLEGDGAYQVSWTEAPERLADTYTLQEATNLTFSANLRTVCTTAQQSCPVTGRPAGTYYYRVRGVNTWGSGNWSATKSVTVAPPPYTPVLNPITDPEGDGAYQVSWTETPQRFADTYMLQEAIDPDFTMNLRTVCITEQQSCGVTERQPRTYYYRVRGENEAGVSDWSATEWVIVAPPSALVNGDFEDGPDVGWEAYSSHGWSIIVDRDSLPSGLDPRSGSWVAWLGGEYDDLSLVAQEVMVPSSNPYVVFWYWIASDDLCGYDFGGVVVNFDTVVDVFDLCSDENTDGWVRRSINLAAYAGQKIIFDIRAETDNLLNSNLLVDDVSFAASGLGDAFRPGAAGLDASGLKGEMAERPVRRVPGKMRRPQTLEVQRE
jgi:hypothetical protein